MQRIEQAHADNWLKENVQGRGFDTITRQKAILQLAREINGFLKARGYILLVGVQDFANGIATVLYHNRGHGLMGPFFFQQQYDYGDEYMQHYNDRINTMEWEKFWDVWGSWGDVSLDSATGFYRRLDVEEYALTQINHTISPQTKVLESLMKDPEEAQGCYEED